MRKKYACEDLGQASCETNTVSEAFSKAMKTLSDFSYDGLFLYTAEYLPTKLSVFQSNSPLPNFHYPNTVHLAPPGSLNSPIAPADSHLKQTDFVNEPSSLSCEASPSQSTDSDRKHNDSWKTIANRNAVQPSASNFSVNPTCASVQARRGRPKKRRGGCDDDEEDYYGAQTMILKEEDDAENLATFNCTVCNEIFKGMNNLMQHVEKVHLSLNPHECCICKKRFAQAGNVKRHIRFVHLRERPFQCRNCSSTFDRLCYLQRHMRSHVDPKVRTRDVSRLNPCNCPECGKRCLTAHHLRGHMRRKHFAKTKKLSEDFVKKYGHLFDDMDVCVTGAEPQKVYKCEDERKTQWKETESSANSHLGHKPESTKGNYSNAPQLQALLQSEAYAESKANTRREENRIEIAQPRTRDQAKRIQFPLIPNKLRGRRRKRAWLYRDCAIFSKKFSAGLQYKCRHCTNRRFSGLILLKSHIALAHHCTTRRHLCLICGCSYSMKSSLIAHITRRHVQKRQRHKRHFAAAAQRKD